LLNTMVINKTGFPCAIQLKTLLLKRIQVVLEPILKILRDHSLESELHAKDLHKLKAKMLLDLILTLGLTSATQLRILSLKRIQAVLEPIRKVPRVHSQELALTAKDLLRLEAEMLSDLTPMLGLKNAIQPRIPSLKRTQVVLEHIMERKQRDLSQELVLTAKVLLKLEVVMSLDLTPMLGLISVIQHRTLSLKRTQVVLEPILKKLKDHSQVSELTAKDLLKKEAKMLLDLILMLGLTSVIQLRTQLLRRTQVVLVKALSQVLALTARASPKRNIIGLTKSSAEAVMESQIAMVPTVNKELTAAEKISPAA